MMTRRRMIGAVVTLALAVFLPLAERPMTPTWSAFTHTTANSLNSFTAASSFYKAQILANGPVGYWRLGEQANAPAAVDVMGASNGSFVSGLNVSVDRALLNDTDGAIAFDGAGGRINIPHVPAFALSTGVTVEAWVKPDTLVGHRFIFNKSDHTYLYIFDGGGIFGFNRTSGQGVFSIATNTVRAGVWQHLVGTYDGTTMVLYRNGVQVASANPGAGIQANTYPIVLGAYTDTTTGPFYDGRIDEVALYNKGLSAAQVLADYERGALTRP